jgi:hypothetical protein
VVAMFVFFASTLVFMVSLVCIFMRRTRPWAKWSLPAAILTALMAAIIGGMQADTEAKALGFLDAADKLTAQKAGFAAAGEWALKRKQILAEQATAVARAKAKEDEDRAAAAKAAVALKQEADVKKTADEQAAKLTADTKLATENAAKAEKDAACRKDLTCWAERSSVRAGVYCRDPVERLAINSFEWIDGWLEPKFSHYKWADRSKGVVTFIGDRIKFQNGFGASTIHVYECDYDTIGERVLTVRAKPGRLP